ncbi:MAG: hypothetical protein JSS27_17620 [Planctomycetes bacterium]|nr:hypothetical protein [Planctomycetota bacterium]
MTIPEKIRIKYEPDYHTDQIGTFSDGQQFMAFVTATLPTPPPVDWPNHKRWYAVLHAFDADGEHETTKAWFAGTTADGEAAVVEKAQARLKELIAALGKVEHRDVEIRLFSVEIHGHTFGLVDASEPDEEYESVHLLPNDLAFFAPWDGDYDT